MNHHHPASAVPTGSNPVAVVVHSSSPPDLLTDSASPHRQYEIPTYVSSRMKDLLSDDHHHHNITRNNEETETPYVSMEMEEGGGGGGPRRVIMPDNDDENENDALSLTPSILSSVMTADGIYDVTGFYVVCFVILLGDMSRGVMFPTMWPLVESLGGNKVTMGYAIAAFSFGRILVNPIFGAWSESIGYTYTLLISCTVLLLGTLCYAQVQNVGNVDFLIVAQTILGIGSGTLGVTRAFVAEVTATRNRTTYIALLTAVQYGGFTVTPLFGALFTMLLGDHDYQAGPFRLNMFTAPAYFMTAVCVFTIVLLMLYFKDRQRMTTVKDKKKMTAKQSAIAEVALSNVCFGFINTYEACILGCMLLNVSTKGSIGCFEALGVSFADRYVGMGSSTVGTIVACCGAIGVVALLCMGHLSTIMTDVQMICGGMIVMCFGTVSLASMEEDPDKASSWRYILSIFTVYSIGYPIGHTAVVAIFSKIVGRRPQGVLQGYFASAGSLARIIFPVMSGYIANYRDDSAVFWLLTLILAISTIFTLNCQHTLDVLSK